MRQSKKIMVLGAGVYQVPIINKAHEMGLFVTAVSRRGNYPGFAIADECLYLDTTDEGGILAAAKDRSIGAIITTGTDVSVRALGKTCELLNLCGISESAARLVTNKAQMKKAFLDGGVNSAEFLFVSNLDGAFEACGQLGYPVVVKACNSSGSRGIHKVDSISQLCHAYESASRISRDCGVLVERCVSGTEIGVDAYVWDGEIVMYAPHAKFVLKAGNTTIPEGHAFPLNENSTTLAEIYRQLQLSVEACGLDNCAVNADMFILPDGNVSVVEIGGRCGATCIPELISIHFGIDYYKQMILGAFGEEPAFSPKGKTPCAAKLLFSKQAGTVKSIDHSGLSKLSEQVPGTIIKLDIDVGAKINAVQNGSDRWGHVIAKTNSESALDQLIEQARTYVELA